MPKKKQIHDKEAYQSDVLDLHRKILQGVLLQDLTFADELRGQERIEFLKYCSMVASSPWFEQIFSALYWPHIVHAATQAPNYDVVVFNRATGNGINLAREFFNKYERRYQIEIEGKKDDFDERKPFEPAKRGS